MIDAFIENCSVMMREKMLRTPEHRDDVMFAVAASSEGGDVDQVDSTAATGPRLLPPSRQTSIIEAAKTRGEHAVQISRSLIPADSALFIVFFLGDSLYRDLYKKKLCI